MSKILKIEFHGAIDPLRTVFATSLGRKNKIHNVIVKIILSNDIYGIGEIPTSFVLKHETIPAIKRIIKDFSARFKRLLINDYEENIHLFRQKYCRCPMSVSGLEIALFRAYIANKGSSEYKYWGAKLSRIETDITVPFIPEIAPLKKWLIYALKNKFRIYKVKVSGNVKQDMGFLSNVRGFLRDNLADFILRLDGNQGYTPDSFLKITDLLVKAGIKIECFEQPLLKNNYKGLKQIKNKSPFPVILDETVFNCRDLSCVIEQGLGHGINIKLVKSGILETRKMLAMAKKAKLKLMIGCMTETFVGLSAGINCASGTGVFDFIDLDSIYFLYGNSEAADIKINAPYFIIKDK